MNYYPIHTNILPSYNYLSAENAYLKQDIEFKNAVLVEQQQSITTLHANAMQSIAEIKSELTVAQQDAARWKAMKKILLAQGGPDKAAEVEAIVDNDIQKSYASSSSKED